MDSIKNSVLLVGLETTNGTAVTPALATDAVAIRVQNLKMGSTVKKAKRDIITGTMGNDDQVPYSHVIDGATFSTELCGSGTLGTAPAWGRLLQMSGFAETVIAPGTGVTGRAEYTPAKTGFRSATIFAQQFGRLDKFYWCMAKSKIGAKVGEMMSLDLTVSGLVTEVKAGSLGGSPTLSQYIRGQAVGAKTTSKVSMGAGCAYANGAISGGAQFNMLDYSLDCAQVVEITEAAGGRTVGLYDFSPSVDITVDLSAAAFESMKGAESMGTTIPVGYVHGDTAGKRVLVYHPACVIDSIEDVQSGNNYVAKMKLLPQESVAGASDWVRIVSV